MDIKEQLEKSVIMEHSLNKKEFGFSPFSFMSGMVMQCDNLKTDCSSKELHRLIDKGHINTVDYAIIKVVCEYGYITKYTAKKILDMELSACCMGKDDYSRNFKKLFDYGILRRYYITCVDDKSMLKRTPCFYALSPGGLSFARKLVRSMDVGKGRKFFYSEELPNRPVEVLRRIIENQFIISAVTTGYLKDFKRELVVKSGKTRVSIPYVFRVNIDSVLKDFILFSVRRNEGWQKEVSAKLSVVVSSEFFKEKVPIIVVACEDELQAKDLYGYMKSSKELNNLTVLFTTDTVSITDDVLKCFIRFETLGSFSIVSVVR